MEISREIADFHRRLSTLNLRFLEFVRQNPGNLRRSNYKLLELDSDLAKFQPWPTFINQKVKKEMKEAGEKVYELIKCIPERIFGNDLSRIACYYEIPERMAEYFFCGTSRTHLDNLIVRGDFILSFDGFKCIEYNVNTNLGGIQYPFWISLYQQIPVISTFFRKYHMKMKPDNVFLHLIEHLIDAIIKNFPSESREINVAVVQPGYTENSSTSLESQYMNNIYMNRLHLKSDTMEGRMMFCEFSHLHIEEGGIFYKDKRVHAIFELYDGFVPPEIIPVVKGKKVIIFNGSIAWLLSTKLNLALLSEYENSDCFSPEERATIKKYIPWTRKITPGLSAHDSREIDLKRFVLSNRQKLVLKPSVGSGGEGIAVGKNISETSWNELVNKAFDQNDWRDIGLSHHITWEEWDKVVKYALTVNNWVVQEYVESPTYLYQFGEDGCEEHNMVWGFFIFGSRFAGSCVRIVPSADKKGVINTHQGAKKSFLFEVED